MAAHVSEYTRRYADIVNTLPSASRDPDSGFSFEAVDAATQERLLQALRAYLNLCSEEFYLRSRGRIDADTWEIWQQGIRETTRLPWIRTTWQTMRREYSYFEPFCAFVDECVGETPLPGPAAGLAVPRTERDADHLRHGEATGRETSSSSRNIDEQRRLSA